MAKAEMVDVVADLKKLLAQDKLVLGSEGTLKGLRGGRLRTVLLASNCDARVKAEVEHLCRVAGVECVTLLHANEEIGVLCKKPFAISVVGVLA